MRLAGKGDGGDTGAVDGGDEDGGGGDGIGGDGRDSLLDTSLAGQVPLHRFDADVQDIASALFHLRAAADCGNMQGTLLLRIKYVKISLPAILMFNLSMFLFLVAYVSVCTYIKYMTVFLQRWWQ